MNKAEREKKLKILLPVLIIISGFVWLPNFQRKPSKEGQSNITKKKTASDSYDLTALIASSSQNIQKQKSSFQDWGRNPFMVEGWEPTIQDEGKITEEIPVEEIIPESKIVLNGIFWNKKKPGALINDEVVGIGTRLNNFTVINISPESVMINDGEKEMILKMRKY